MDAFYADAFRQISSRHDEFVRKYPQCRTGEVLDRRLAAYHELNGLKSEWLNNRRAPHEILGGIKDTTTSLGEGYFSYAFAMGHVTPVAFTPCIFGMGVFEVVGRFYLPLAALGAGGVAIQSLVNSNSDLGYVE